jgi:phosphonate transport system substrate-binding protein
MNQRLQIVLTTLVLLFTTVHPSVVTATEPLILAVHPYLPEAELKQRFTPLAEYLSHILEQPVIVRIGRNYDEHIDAIGKDQVDIAFMGPAAYIKMVDKYGSKPLLARFEVNNSPNLYGVIITRKDSPIQNLKQLQNKRFAFGDQESTMSHIVPRYMLAEAGIPVSALSAYKFLGSHHNVAIAVLAGDFDAGAVKREVFLEFEPRGLRVLAQTPATPDHLFVTSATMPVSTIDKLRKALLQLSKQPNGKKILTAMHKELTNLIPAKESDYEQLRTIVHKIEADH